MNAADAMPMRDGAIRVTLVGTGGGIAAAGRGTRRNGPAVVLRTADVTLLFDAGRNVLGGLHDHAIDPAGITHLVFTHYHSDHTIGLPDLVLSTWVASGRSRWHVLGPAGARRLLDGLFGPAGAFRPDIEARAFSPSSRRLFEQRLGTALEPPTFDVLEIQQAGPVAAGLAWELEASLAPDHVQPALLSLAYRFTTRSGSVVITGDTGPNAAIADFARGADLLIHDCTLPDRAGVYQHAGVHTDPESLGRVAASAGVKAVVGTHVTGGRDRPELLREFPALVARAYHGPFRMAVDGLQVDIGDGDVRFPPLGTGAVDGGPELQPM